MSTLNTRLEPRGEAEGPPLRVVSGQKQRAGRGSGKARETALGHPLDARDPGQTCTTKALSVPAPFRARDGTPPWASRSLSRNE